MSTINLFVNNINELYGNFSIYRAIIVVNNDKENNLIYNKLKNTNHNPICYINNNDIDYNYRLFIVNKKDFNIFINKIDIDEYNFIAFSYEIDDINDYIKYFLEKTNNNINEIYIHNIESLNNNILYNKYN